MPSIYHECALVNLNNYQNELLGPWRRYPIHLVLGGLSHQLRGLAVVEWAVAHGWIPLGDSFNNPVVQRVRVVDVLTLRQEPDGWKVDPPELGADLLGSLADIPPTDWKQSLLALLNSHGWDVAPEVNGTVVTVRRFIDPPGGASAEVGTTEELLALCHPR